MSKFDPEAELHKVGKKLKKEQKKATDKFIKELEKQDEKNKSTPKRGS
jgi:hypothetical protein